MARSFAARGTSQESQARVGGAAPAKRGTVGKGERREEMLPGYEYIEEGERLEYELYYVRKVSIDLRRSRRGLREND